MLLDRDERERLRRTPFWVRMRDRRLLGCGAALIALGLVSPRVVPDPELYTFWIFHLVPVRAPHFFHAGVGLGVLTIVLWTFASLRPRLVRGDE